MVQNNWVKKLIVDVDDTISVHINRDYKNAIPKSDIIQKLNSLYDIGYYILYFTARGQISCNGDIDLINKTHRHTLETWLLNNNVKYNELLFGKPLGQLYIDDKAITPDDFLKMEFYLLKGNSNSNVHREGSTVVKTAENTYNQVEWYNIVKDSLNVPKVLSLIENTLRIEYIDGIEGFKINTVNQLKNILSQIEKIKDIQYENICPFSTYIQRVQQHLNITELLPVDIKIKIIDIMTSNEEEFNKYTSFCHGDLTLGNIIINNKKIYLIDPNTPKNVWMSYLLDLAKINQSIRFDYEYFFMSKQKKYSYHLKQFYLKYIGKYNIKLIIILEITHWVRIIKYVKIDKYEHVKSNIYQLLKIFQELNLHL